MSEVMEHNSMPQYIWRQCIWKKASICISLTNGEPKTQLDPLARHVLVKRFFYSQNPSLMLFDRDMDFAPSNLYVPTNILARFQASFFKWGGCACTIPPLFHLESKCSV